MAICLDFDWQTNELMLYRSAIVAPPALGFFYIVS